jgi:hypothetical protein
MGAHAAEQPFAGWRRHADTKQIDHQGTSDKMRQIIGAKDYRFMTLM